jgi:hypothetical protein
MDAKCIRIIGVAKSTMKIERALGWIALKHYLFTAEEPIRTAHCQSLVAVGFDVCIHRQNQRTSKRHAAVVASSSCCRMAQASRVSTWPFESRLSRCSLEMIASWLLNLSVAAAKQTPRCRCRALKKCQRVVS